MPARGTTCGDPIAGRFRTGPRASSSKAWRISRRSGCTRPSAAFVASLQRLPGRVSTRINLAATRLRLGRAAEALAELDAVLAAEPQHLDAWCHRAAALAELGRDAESLAMRRPCAGGRSRKRVGLAPPRPCAGAAAPLRRGAVGLRAAAGVAAAACRGLVPPRPAAAAPGPPDRGAWPAWTRRCRWHRPMPAPGPSAARCSRTWAARPRPRPPSSAPSNSAPMPS